MSVAKEKRDTIGYVIEKLFGSGKSEISLRVYFVYAFSFASFFFIYIIGISGVSSFTYETNIFILGGTLFLFINLAYLKITGDIYYAEYIVLYVIFGCVLYLVYTGGYHNTGPLWVFALPPLTLFIHGLRRGLADIAVFLFVLLFLFFYPSEYLLEADYTTAFKIQIMLSLFALVFLSALYEYFREKSMKKMKKVQHDLEFFLKRDPLTGLYNRRGYHASMDQISGRHGVMLMCDIDHFKKINDTYGHDAGDFVIQEIAQCIRENIRKDDLAIRWGGEEFLIFLADTNIQNGYLVAEKLRESVERLTMHYRKDITIKVTLSMGISLINSQIPLEKAIRNADHAMYISKSSGRNQISRS